MSLLLIACSPIAALYIIMVVRALPGIRGLTERGVKPWACDRCMPAWVTLAWQLVGLFVQLPADTRTWALWFMRSTVIAGATFLLLRVYRWAEMRVGFPDESRKAEEYEPPSQLPSQPREPLPSQRGADTLTALRQE